MQSETWTLDESSKSLIRRAVRALAEVCDGATSDDGRGFNGRDTAFGKGIAAKPDHYWTPKMYATAYRMLRTYRVQLSRLGIDFDAITEPTEPPVIVPNPVAHSYGKIVGVIADGIITWNGPTQSRAILGPGGLISQKLPGYEAREAQIEMAELVEHSLANEQNAAIEAGTGTGKSLGYLVPAILTAQVPNRPRRTTIVSTADKSLQAQIWGKDIPFLQSVMPPFTAALLKGRGNYLCLHAVDTATKRLQSPTFEGVGFAAYDTGERFAEVNAWATTTVTGDLEELPFPLSAELREMVAVDSEGCIGKACPFVSRCWSEKAKERAEKADIVIVNHALLMRDVALRQMSDGMVSVLPDADHVVLDEAHHLEDIATDALGTELTIGGWNRVLRGLDRLTVEYPSIAAKLKLAGKGATISTESGTIISTLTDPEVIAAQSFVTGIERLTGQLDRFFGAIRERMEKANLTVQRLGDETPNLDAFGLLFADYASDMKQNTPTWLTEAEDRERWDKLAARIRKTGDDLIAIATPDPENRTVRYAELTGTGIARRLILHRKPIDVSDELRRGLFESSYRSVISTSATISTAGDRPFDFWCARVGCDEPAELTVSSPFDYGRQSLLYLPEDGKAFDPTQSRGEESIAYLDRIAAEIERLILASSGRAFVLFTSFKTLDECYRRLSPRLADYLVLRQGELSRPELVKRFREHGSAVLFGVKSFWEGVDVQGEALSLVIIDKLPFTPPNDPVWDARKDAITARAKASGRRDWEMAWFFELALPTAIIALKQGFGRLIRTRSDRGVVALLDGRLSTKGYGTRVVRAMPPATQTRSLDAVRAFFG